jgi:hypothetical protein
MADCCIGPYCLCYGDTFYPIRRILATSEFNRKKKRRHPRNPRLFLHHNDQVGEECRLKLLERLWKLRKGAPGSQMGTWVKQAGRSPSEFFLLAHRTHPNGQTVLFMDRSVINRV